MKFCKRFTAALLSGLLVIGSSGYALAAEQTAALKKEESVYLVLEQDGSVRERTVSSHLYSPDGLSGVKDQSNLNAIENTQDNSTFTQNGQELIWDTDKTDVYYKGVTDRSAPISANISYSLDGEKAPINDLLGKSGRLKITVQLTNNDIGSFKIDGKSQKVCTPFITMVGITLGEGFENVDAPSGVIKSLGTNEAAGFVCMPGVRECIEDIIPDGASKLKDIDDMEKLLTDEIILEADVEELSAPSIFIICGTDSQQLREEGFSQIKSLNELDGLKEDIDALDKGMAELIDGAEKLTGGATDLNFGALELVSGLAQLVGGAAQLDLGAVSLRDGAATLSNGADEASAGADELKSGADQLYFGLSDLQSGAGALSGGYAQLKSGSENLTSGLSTLCEKNDSLLAGISQVSDGINALYSAAGPDGQLSKGITSFGIALESASANSTATLNQLLTPQSYGELLDSAGLSDDIKAQLLTTYSEAYNSAEGMSGGLTELLNNYVVLEDGFSGFYNGIAALQAGVNGESGLKSGIEAYAAGVKSARSGAVLLDSGLSELGVQLPALTEGVEQLVSGSGQLSAGAGSLRDGNAALAEGARRLATGGQELLTGTNSLQNGVAALANGAASLQSGTSELLNGANQLEAGLNRYNDEGISQLTSFDTEELTSLKELFEQMENRKLSYGSFSGAPDGAEVTTKFIMKTAEESVPVESLSEEADLKEDKSFF